MTPPSLPAVIKVVPSEAPVALICLSGLDASCSVSMVVGPFRQMLIFQQLLMELRSMGCTHQDASSSTRELLRMRLVGWVWRGLLCSELCPLQHTVEACLLSHDIYISKTSAHQALNERSGSGRDFPAAAQPAAEPGRPTQGGARKEGARGIWGGAQRGCQ